MTEQETGEEGKIWHGLGATGLVCVPPWINAAYCSSLRVSLNKRTFVFDSKQVFSPAQKMQRKQFVLSLKIQSIFD